MALILAQSHWFCFCHIFCYMSSWLFFSLRWSSSKRLYGVFPTNPRGQMPRRWFPSIDACGMCLARVCSVWYPNIPDLLNVADFSPIHDFWSNRSQGTGNQKWPCFRSLEVDSTCSSFWVPQLGKLKVPHKHRALKKGQWVEINLAKHGLDRQIHHYSLILCSCEVIVSMLGPNFKQRQGTP